MANEKVQKIVDLIKELSVVEAFELKKALEVEFDVKASAPMVAMAVAPSSSDSAVEEKTDFAVVLTNAGTNKIGVIKVVKAITGLGLKESKDAVDGLPFTIKESAKKEDAEDIKKQIEEVGGTVELK